MTFWGWIIMLVSVLSVTLLFGWCIWKVLTTRGETEHLHGSTNIDKGED
jgi:heme/copper-type cytochrome/quinol oxidase subunit 2